MNMPQVPGANAAQRGASALAIYAAFFLVLLAGFSFSNSLLASGSADVTPSPSVAGP